MYGLRYINAKWDQGAKWASGDSFGVFFCVSTPLRGSKVPSGKGPLPGQSTKGEQDAW